MAEKLIEIKIDEKKLRQIQQMLRDVPAKMGLVISRSINRTTAGARADIAREIAGRVNMKQAAIKKGIIQKKSNRNYWQGELDITSRRIPLIEFSAGQTARGVTYRIDKTGGRQLRESAFIATMASGHTGVFRRKAKGRLPIVELRGPSVGIVFEGAAGLTRRIEALAYKKLEQNIDSQVRYILEKRKTG